MKHLAARLQETYLPLYTERSQWTDRLVNLERPLFPGYVFVRLQPEARLSVLSTPGVLRLLGNTERDTVGEAEMCRIREGLANGCLLRPHLGVVKGSPVRVLRGLFAGAEGVVADLRKPCSVILTLSATGSCFSLEVALEDVALLHTGTIRNSPSRGQPLILSGI